MLRRIATTALSVLVLGTMALAGESQIAKGQVTDVSGNTVTVAGDEGQVGSFEVTSATRVIAEGAAHKADRLSAVGLKTTLDQFVRENDQVTVDYYEQDGTRFVETLRVR